MRAVGEHLFACGRIKEGKKSRRLEGEKLTDSERKKHKNLTWLARFVKSLQDKDFYGQLVLDFKAGEIKKYNQNKTGKPD